MSRSERSVTPASHSDTTIGRTSLAARHGSGSDATRAGANVATTIATALGAGAGAEMPIGAMGCLTACATGREAGVFGRYERQPVSAATTTSSSNAPHDTA